MAPFFLFIFIMNAFSINISPHKWVSSLKIYLIIMTSIQYSIDRFNSATFLLPFQARTWISNVICRGSGYFFMPLCTIYTMKRIFKSNLPTHNQLYIERQHNNTVVVRLVTVQVSFLFIISLNKQLL